MNRLLLGELTIILGGLALSFQLYGLKLIQALEAIHGEWRLNAMEYAEETPIGIALTITVAVILYGIWIVLAKKPKNK